MAMSEKTATPTVGQYDIQYLQRQIDSLYKSDQDIKKLIKLLVRILVDKKIIGEELAKTFEESKKPAKEDLAKLIDWLFK